VFAFRYRWLSGKPFHGDRSAMHSTHESSAFESGEVSADCFLRDIEFRSKRCDLDSPVRASKAQDV
jgi:hypothetical protein